MVFSCLKSFFVFFTSFWCIFVLDPQKWGKGRKSAGEVPEKCRRSAGEEPEKCRRSAGEVPEGREKYRRSAGEVPEKCRRSAGEVPEKFWIFFPKKMGGKWRQDVNLSKNLKKLRKGVPGGGNATKMYKCVRGAQKRPEAARPRRNFGCGPRDRSLVKVRGLAGPAFLFFLCVCAGVGLCI